MEHLLKMFVEEVVLLEGWEQAVCLELRTRGLRSNTHVIRFTIENR